MQDYILRRQALAATLKPNSIALIPAAQEQLRNGDAHYRFRQDSDFYYLTGFDEPEALLVICNDPEPKTVLFNRPRDKAQEVWTGRRLGQEGAITTLGVDKAYSLELIAEKLPELLANKEQVYFDLNRSQAWDSLFFDAMTVVKSKLRRGVLAPLAVVSVHHLISEMRLFKSSGEIAKLKQAAKISVKAHQLAMQACQPGMREYTLEGILVGHFIKEGCRSVAYDSIVAGGANACVLHYTANDELLNNGDLVLIDAGGEYQNYAADITRTFPINGRFSPQQRQLYEVVLKAQRAGIACIKPGVLWHHIQEILVLHLTEGLVRLGILKGEVSDLIQADAYKPFYMHSSGHWLGLDVHDVGQYKIGEHWRPLEPNMVLTIEPGLYIAPGTPDVDPCWHGIGIRIEDDICVTETGFDNLTQALPVEVDEIEAFMRG